MIPAYPKTFVKVYLYPDSGTVDPARIAVPGVAFQIGREGGAVVLSAILDSAQKESELNRAIDSVNRNPAFVAVATFMEDPGYQKYLLGTLIPWANTLPKPAPAICKKDARQCPDGTWVTRTGPNCEFRPCPPPSKTTYYAPGKESVVGSFR